MAITIHFFRNRSLKRIEYDKLIEFFTEQPTFRRYDADDYVELLNHDENFELSYRFLITKRSRVNSIYNLSPDYVNINFLLEFPTLIPSFVAREILKLTQEMCKIFELETYYNGIQNIEPFNMVKLINYFEGERKLSLEKTKPGEKYFLDKDKLSTICKYQQSVGELREIYKDEYKVNRYLVLANPSTGEVALSVSWELGTPIVLPPFITHIHLEEENNLPAMIPAEHFRKFMGKYLVEVKEFLPDIYLLKKRAANKARTYNRKLRKETIPSNMFKVIRLSDLLEE
jgi:hypothetical protein